MHTDQPGEFSPNQQAAAFLASDAGLAFIRRKRTKGYTMKYILLFIYERVFANFAHMSEGERQFFENGLGDANVEDLQEIYPALRE